MRIFTALTLASLLATSAASAQDLTVNSAPTSGAALVRHGITLNGLGGVDGSLQVLLPEGDTLNGNAYISGKLFVAGTPSIKANAP